MKLNMDKIIEDTKMLFNEARWETQPSTVQFFVEDCISRHEHLIKSLDLDENLRRVEKIEVTPEVLLQTKWFRKMCFENAVETQHLTILQNNIWVTQGNKAMPLTKYLSKRRDTLLNRGIWHTMLDRDVDDLGNQKNLTVDSFLCKLGEITSLDREVVISANPFDFLRKSFYPKYAAFTTCHNLLTGGYRYGPINYALTKTHLVNYIRKPDNDKMLARVMMYISDDNNIVGQRRFYPTLDVFGEYRSDVLRQMVHNKISDTPFTKGSVKINHIGNLGYIDGLSVLTYKEEPKGSIVVEMNDSLFCMRCGKYYTKRQNYCDSCHMQMHDKRPVKPVTLEELRQRHIPTTTTPDQAFDLAF